VVTGGASFAARPILSATSHRPLRKCGVCARGTF